MKNGQQGFTIVEMIAVVGITAIIALIAVYFTFHAYRTSAQTNDHFTAISHEQNAGYWISCDIYMADYIIADNLTQPTFLILKSTDWGYGTDNVYNTITYSIENVSDGVGQLKRRLQDSLGADQQIIVASYIYYDSTDPSNTTKVTYSSLAVNLTVATRHGNTSQTKEYIISRRPNF